MKRRRPANAAEADAVPATISAAAPGFKVRIAKGFFARMRGLMFLRDMQPDDALLIPDCPAIHTLFMRFPIDIVFFDKSGAPVKTLRAVKPWHPIVWGGPRAHSALEYKSRRAP